LPVSRIAQKPVIAETAARGQNTLA